MASKILIVDDEPDLLRLIAYALQIEGYQIVTASTGMEGLRKVQSENPDLAILDLMLPDINGVEICKQLRSQPETADLPIMVLSARVQVADKVRALQAGADEYVSKPVDSDELVARVKALLKFTDRLRQSSPAKAGRVLAVMGVKGGVGATTVALNIATLLASQKKSVIAAELRPSLGTFSLALKHPAGRSLADLIKLEPRQMNEREVTNCLFATQFGPKILFGPQSPEDCAELEPVRLEAILERLSGMAEYIIVDLPAQPSAASQALVRHCNLVALVTEPEPLSAAMGKAAVQRLMAWNVSLTQIVAIIVNRVALAMPLSFADVRSQLGCGIAGTVPQAADVCAAAQGRGLPLAAFKPDQLAVGSLHDITGRLVAAIEGGWPARLGVIC